MNQTISSQMSGATNLKALKNESKAVTNLIENRPMQYFANKMAMEDTSRFMTLQLQKRKPIFKNYIKNNASILRSEIQTNKKQEY